MECLVSVIIPLWNQEELVLKGLDSVPEREDVEIIIIDDGSTDNSLKVVQEYKKNSNKDITILVNEKNKGEAYAANRGIDIAKGKYITRLDSDGDYFVNFEKAIPYLDGTDIVYYCLEINSGEVWEVSERIRSHCGGAVNFIRREFLGDLRHPRLESNCDLMLYKELLKKNPTEKFIEFSKMYKHYNYPREGSMIWKVFHGIIARGQVRDD